MEEEEKERQLTIEFNITRRYYFYFCSLQFILMVHSGARSY